MKRSLVLVTGGGSGGHITPVLAVVHQLKLASPQTSVVYVGPKGDQLSDVPAADPNIDRVYSVRAGKFRRYHGAGWRQLVDLPTIAKNLRDVLYVLIGIVQSLWLLRRLRPQVVFVRGSFVGVPIGIAAGLLKIPIITHDSDAIPGLTHRLIARWTTIHAVALPKEVYRYPAAKTVTVGVPISHHYAKLTAAAVRTARETIGVSNEQRLVLMTGGGHGAGRLNESTMEIAPALLTRYPELVLVILAGRIHAETLSKKYNNSLTADMRNRLRIESFVSNLYDYSAVADVVITRAGGTSMAEFAAQAKACVVVPNPELTGGHQTKNAQVLADRQAVIIVTEAELRKDKRALLAPIVDLLDHPEAARDMAEKLHSLGHPDAAKRLAMLLLEQVKR